MSELMRMVQQLAVRGGQNSSSMAKNLESRYGQVKSQVETLAKKLCIIEDSSVNGRVDLESLTSFP